MNIDRKPLGHYKQKSDYVTAIHDEGIVGKITHWDFFHINRETGKTMDNCCLVEIVTGTEKGKVYVTHCNWIGNHIPDNDWHWT